MKKFLLFFCIILTIVFASCKSTEQDTSNQIIDEQPSIGEQQPEEPAPEQPKIEEQIDDSDAIAKDKEERQKALEKIAEAKKLKERIDNEDLAKNAQSDYDHGEKAMEQYNALAEIPLTPGKALSLKAEEVYNSYYSVYFKSYKKFANEERKNAIQQKKAADAVKAQIARKEEYKAYAELIAKGDSSYATSNPEGAYNSYKEAATSYEKLAADVTEKRAAAQKAIEEAKAKVKAANEYAANADKENPLGDEHVDGIEAEDTVLLEKDEFANPEEQVIEIKDIDQSVEEQVQKTLEETVIDAVKDSIRQGDLAK